MSKEIFVYMDLRGRPLLAGRLWVHTQEYGAEVSQDLAELWRRMVFNIMVSNVDDHLRNHGFLHDGQNGWRLSPVYDLEPTPVHVKPRILHTRIDFHDGTASLEAAYAVAGEFGLNGKKAASIAREVAESTRNWEREASRFGAKKEEIESMRSAFEHKDLRDALR
jgi:serine/threonine-protein kinase HipA